MAKFPPLQSDKFTSRDANGFAQRPATLEESQRITSVNEAISKVDVPLLFDPANNPNQKLFYVSFDGSWNDRDKQSIDSNPAELQRLVRDEMSPDTGVSIYKWGWLPGRARWCARRRD